MVLLSLNVFPNFLAIGNAPWLDTVEYPPMLTIEYNI